jgi:hypothetical protein
MALLQRDVEREPHGTLEVGSWNPQRSTFWASARPRQGAEGCLALSAIKQHDSAAQVPCDEGLPHH